MNKKIAIFPGSFNPFHEGHHDVLEQAADLFETIYVVVTFNPEKEDNDNFDKRVSFIEEKIGSFKNVKVLKNINKLTADFANELNCNYLIRGMRNSKDFEYELKLSDANSYVNKHLTTIFFITNKEKRGISSTLIKEINDVKKKMNK